MRAKHPNFTLFSRQTETGTGKSIGPSTASETAVVAQGVEIEKRCAAVVKKDQRGGRWHSPSEADCFRSLILSPIKTVELSRPFH